MSGKLGFAIGLLVGSGIGAISAYFVLDKKLNQKYEDIVEEEIRSVKEAYKIKQEENEAELDKLSEIGKEIQKHIDADKKIEQEEAVKRNQNKPDLMKYYDTVQKEGYTRYSENDDLRDHDAQYKEVLDPDREPMILDEAFCIKPEVYEDGLYDGFEQVCLTYYADGVLCRDDNRPIEEDEMPGIVPDDFAEWFGVYEGYEDIVFTRNDFTKLDYEICRSNLTYAEIAENMPRPVKIVEDDDEERE